MGAHAEQLHVTEPSSIRRVLSKTINRALEGANHLRNKGLAAMGYQALRHVRRAEDVPDNVILSEFAAAHPQTYGHLKMVRPLGAQDRREIWYRGSVEYVENFVFDGPLKSG